VLEKLRDLACWALIAREYRYDVKTARQWYNEAVVNNSPVWFARWATDHLLNFLISGRVSNNTWTTWYLMELSDVMDDFEKATESFDQAIINGRLQEVEATRFDELLNLLTECFSYTEQSLKETRDSNTGIEELLGIANESDIVCLQNDLNLRLTYRDMRQTQCLPRHVCFRVISGHVIERLKARKHSVPVDNALRNMLKVIPELDEYILSKIPLEDWYATLKKCGFAVNAATLAMGIQNEHFLRSAPATPASVVSHSQRTPRALLPLDHRPSPLEYIPTPIKKTVVDNGDDDANDDGNDEKDDDEDKIEFEDEDEDDNEDWVGVNLSVRKLSPYPPVDPSPEWKHTFKSLFQPGYAQTSEGTGNSRASGLRYDRSYTKRKSTPSVCSQDSDSSGRSTPQPMKRRRANMGTTASNGSGLSEISIRRPMKRGRMSMGTLSSASDGVQSGFGNVTSARDPVLGMSVLSGTVFGVQSGFGNTTRARRSAAAINQGGPFAPVMPSGSGTLDDLSVALCVRSSKVVVPGRMRKPETPESGLDGLGTAHTGNGKVIVPGKMRTPKTPESGRSKMIKAAIARTNEKKKRGD